MFAGGGGGRETGRGTHRICDNSFVTVPLKYTLLSKFPFLQSTVGVLACSSSLSAFKQTRGGNHASGTEFMVGSSAVDVFSNLLCKINSVREVVGVRGSCKRRKKSSKENIAAELT